MLLTSSAIFAQVSVGILIGQPPPPPRVIRVLPPSPGPEYTFVAGYWYPVGNHYKWHDGYYTRPAYRGARWVAPRHDGKRYYAGYWDGARGPIAHDHRWDRDHGNRDRDRRQ
jgi:hypothetical protein